MPRNRRLKQNLSPIRMKSPQPQIKSTNPASNLALDAAHTVKESISVLKVFDMADTSSFPTVNSASPRSNTLNPPDSQQTPNKGRGRGRGPRGQRGNRGRGRGQGFTNAPRPPHDATGTEQSSGRPPGGSFGARLTEAASNIQGDLGVSKEEPQDNAEAEDVEVCFICASPIDHTAIAPCNHQTCHICALRLRALYKTRACAHCRTESPFVIFTDNAEKHYQDFQDDDLAKSDDNMGIKYENDAILEDTILLLRYNCPDKDCDVACFGWPDLHRHVRSTHGKIMCDLCTRNKKVFTHEHELFSFGELRRHEKYGDDNPGAVDQSGFKGHPECGFCKQRFYGDDELYTHCRERHERCHICDRRNGGRNPQYYLDYAQLEKHFADAHFVCLDAECQANKTNVYESEMDLKAHQLSEHPNGMSKDVRRDARLVNLSGFDVRTPYQHERREPRRGNGRGRDPNAEPLPMSSAQNLSRAEMAYQRQMAIQSASSVTPRNFGGQLTQTATSPRPQQSQPARPTSSHAPQSEPPNLGTLTINSTTSPQDRARALRHQAVVDRASTLLGNSQPKLTQFRKSISSYRADTTSATDLIDSFFSLFDCPSSSLGTLIREIADLFEDDTKRTTLLSAWNNWRSINEDYPSLPLPSATPSASSNMGANVSSGRRVLKLKSSTQQSSRSSTARQGSWGNLPSFTPNSSTSNSHSNGRGTGEAFPSLPANTRKQASSAAWGNNPSPATHTTSSTSTTASRANVKPQKPPGNTTDFFPSLPKGVKPNTMISGFNTKATGRSSGNQTPVVNAWGSGGMTPTPAQAAAAIGAVAGEVDGGDDGFRVNGGKGKKSKGKGKGEVLFHFG